MNTAPNPAKPGVTHLLRDGGEGDSESRAGAREWQPIETAPRCVASEAGDNGRRPVLVTRFPFTGHHAPIAVARRTTQGWISGKRGTKLWFQPTHWQPLPAPPLTASKASGPQPPPQTSGEEGGT